MDWKPTIVGVEHQSEGLIARVHNGRPDTWNGAFTWSFTYKNKEGRWIEGGYGMTPTQAESMQACEDRILDVTGLFFR